MLVEFGKELADIVIRVMDLAGCLELDLQTLIIKKDEENNGRPFLYGTANAGKEIENG